MMMMMTGGYDIAVIVMVCFFRDIYFASKPVLWLVIASEYLLVSEPTCVMRGMTRWIAFQVSRLLPCRRSYI